MTYIKVVDASALGALVFNEDAANDIAELLEGSALLAPWLLLHELDSICLKKIKERPRLRRELLHARTIAENLPITYSRVSHPDVVELAIQMRLTTYDAAYLWLARTSHAELVTLDDQLAKAAKL